MRQVLEAVLWLVNAGAQCHMLPYESGLLTSFSDSVEVQVAPNARAAVFPGALLS